MPRLRSDSDQRADGSSCPVNREPCVTRVALREFQTARIHLAKEAFMHCIPIRCAALLVGALTAAASAAQTTVRVSISSAGAQSNGPSLGPGVIAASGDHVSFTSNASNLVAGDTNNCADGFVHDRASGVTERVSVSSAGVQGNLASTEPRVSSDGNRVAFVSTATNLVTGDTNGADDVFVRDRQAGTTVRASVSSSGTQANGHSYWSVMSADGNCVVFESTASNLVSSDTNGASDVFVRELATATTTRVSVATAGVQANDDSNLPSLSGDGRYVVFASSATNLVVNDTNGVRDVFVHDRQSGSTVRVSVDSSGATANAASCIGGQSPAISLDGRYAAFSSAASNLVAGDGNGLIDVFVHDLLLGATTRVSVDSLGAQANGVSYFPCVSGDGRFVGFSSTATNLVAGDTNGAIDVFVHDRQTGQTTRASVTAAGAQATGSSSASLPSSISGDGRSIGFDSGAANLVLGDTNATWDIFVRDAWPAGPLVYCTSSTTANGCTASISASANPDLSHSNACVIAVSGVDGQRTGIVFYGLNSLAQPWCSPGSGTSSLCVKSPTQRTPAQSSGGTFGLCDGSFALDWNAYQLANPSALGNPWSSGAPAFVQCWFRDPTSCKTTSLSDALELTYQP